MPDPAMTTDPKALIERLERKVQAMPVMGSASLTSDGGFTSTIWDDGMRYVNPDGPAAAQALRDLTSQRNFLGVRVAELSLENARLKALGDGLADAGSLFLCDSDSITARAELDAALTAWEKNSDQ